MASAVTVMYLVLASCVCVTVCVTVTVLAAGAEEPPPSPPVGSGLFPPPLLPPGCVAGPGSSGTTEYEGTFWLALMTAAAAMAASRGEL